MRKNIKISLVVLLAFLIALSGCNNNANDNQLLDEKASETEFVCAFTDDVIDGWDPQLAVAWGSTLAAQLVYERLIIFDEHMNITPCLAKEWDFLDDLTLEIKLRENVTWHDGEPFTADDVKYSIERMKDPNNLCVQASKYDTIKEVKVIDSTTLHITTIEPDPTMISKFGDTGMEIVPRHILESGKSLKSEPIGTGPYKMTEHIPDSHITYVKYDDYWDEGLPYFDKITARIIKGDTQKIAAIRAKQADIANITDMQHVQELEKDTNITVISNPSVTTLVALLNTTKKPFNDIRVRKAISMALDREEFLDVVGYGIGELSGPIPPANEYWSLPKEELKQNYIQDIEGAKKLLADAGYPDGFTCEVQVSPGHPYTIAAGQVMQNQLSQIGIKCELQSLEWGLILDSARKKTFEIQFRPSIGKGDPDPYVYEIFYTGASRNYTGISIPEMDELMLQARKTIDLTERKLLYDEIQRMVLDSNHYIYMYAMNEVDILQNNIKGFIQVPNKDFSFWKEMIREE